MPVPGSAFEWKERVERLEAENLDLRKMLSHARQLVEHERAVRRSAEESRRVAWQVAATHAGPRRD